MSEGHRRTCVVTGAASGIGRATCEAFERAGCRVIDVDLRDAAIAVDLGTEAGRSPLVEQVTRAAGGALDVVVANAGVSKPAEACMRVNYFGAVATLAGLQPLLARGEAPRAVATASSSVLNGQDAGLVEARLAGDEPGAVALGEKAGLLAYPSSKRALARWLRRTAPGPDWAGAGIALNAVAPGIIDTPMTAEMFAVDGMTQLMEDAVPMPYGGHARPEHVAELIAFLAAPTTERITGQVVFVDGGADTVLRGDDVW